MKGFRTVSLSRARSWLAAALCLGLLCAGRSGAALETAGPGTGIAFPELAGWQRAPELLSFSPDTLYEHVDGASELYLSYGFRELRVARYTRDDGASLSVEVYRHASPTHAFGIYAQERPREGRFLAVGVEGYLESPVLNLLNGDCYVKLSAEGTRAHTDETLVGLAEAVVTALGGKGRPPEALTFFPTEGLVAHSEGFAARDFLGYSFLHDGFTADYRVGGERFQLFVADGGTPEASASMLQRYAEKTGTTAPAEGVALVVADPYNGEVALFRSGRFLCGAVRLRDGALRERYLAALRRVAGQPR